MKKTISTLILALTLNSALPSPRAEAALVVASVTHGNAIPSLMAMFGAPALVYQLRKKKSESFGHSFGDQFEKGFYDLGTVVLGLLAGFVLDVDAHLPTETLVGFLREELPFIDNIETLENIAVSAKEKLADMEVSDQETVVSVSFNREETLSLLSETELTDEQKEFVIEKLQ